MPSSEIRELVDPSRPHHTDAGPRPVRLHLTRPDRPGPAPLVLLSHGTGSAADQMAWLAEPLAEAGFLVAAVDHHGNNYRDGYTAMGFACWWDRPLDLAFALDRITADEQVGAVGVAGFSLGGYTAAALVGARLSKEVVEGLLSGALRIPPPPEYPTLVEEIAALPAETVASWVDLASADHTDERVRCAFLVAPAVGELLDTDSLTRIRRPVAVRWGDADVLAPPDRNARRYLDLVPGAEGRSVGAHVGHYEFLCRSTEDKPFHAAVRAGGPVRAEVAAEAVEFFRQHLG
ncbi:alpha/beta hydrolase [Thermobifida halotolerans]|uniref:Alpha/beta hydrolase n=1 Tax=Thermobifida halotolerans TaxID=483545 RepID=A0A399G0U1_9ACTN|nr:alpha/beta hydrolase [Thermobifida halotolerans]UOE19295.1 alpha/beta hydrolase [Thermobifida halotolerans]